MQAFLLLNIQNTFLVFSRDDKNFRVVDQVSPKQFLLRLEDAESNFDPEDRQEVVEKLSQIMLVIQGPSGNQRPQEKQKDLGTRTTDEEDVITTLTKKMERIQKKS